MTKLQQLIENFSPGEIVIDYLPGSYEVTVRWTTSDEDLKANSAAGEGKTLATAAANALRRVA